MDIVEKKIYELLIAYTNNKCAYDDDLEFTWDVFLKQYEETRKIIDRKIKTVEKG